MLLYLRKSLLWQGRRSGLDITWLYKIQEHVKYKVVPSNPSSSHFPGPVLKLKAGSGRRRRIDLIGAGVRCGQPAEEALIRSGCVLARGPVPGHVIRVGDHQLSAMEVSAKDKWDVVHPVDDGAGL